MDSPLEDGGFEPLSREASDRRLGRMICCSRRISQVPLIPPERCRRFLERNSGRIGGFEKGEFERHSARKEVAA